MVSRDQIREQLIDYLDDSLSFEQFEDWLIDQSMDMHKGSSPEAQEMVLDLKEAINEYLDQRINEILLKRNLYPFVELATANIIVGERPRVAIRSGSSARQVLRASMSSQAAV